MPGFFLLARLRLLLFLLVFLLFFFLAFLLSPLVAYVVKRTLSNRYLSTRINSTNNTQKLGQNFIFCNTKKVDTYINAFTRSVVLLSLPFFLLLLQLFNALLQHIRPKITFKVRELLSTGQAVLCCLFKNVLGEGESDVKQMLM